MTLDPVVRGTALHERPIVTVRLDGAHDPEVYGRSVALLDGEFLKRDGSRLVGASVPTAANTDHEVNVADSSAVANTASETDVDVGFQIPSRKVVAGDQLKLSCSGIVADSGSPTLTLRLKLDGTTVVTVGPFTLTEGAETRWNTDWLVTFRTDGVSASVWACSRNTQYSDDTIATVKGTTTIDTTQPIDVDVSAQFSAASASNTITLENFSMEFCHG